MVYHRLLLLSVWVQTACTVCGAAITTCLRTVSTPVIPCALLLHVSCCCPEGRLRILFLSRQQVVSLNNADQEEYLILCTLEPIPVGLFQGSKRIKRCQFYETKQTKTKSHTDNRMEVTKGKAGGRRVNWVKGVKCMVTEGNHTQRCEHAVEYIDIEL